MNPVRRLRRDEGQGLIELIVALTILAVGIGAVLTVLTASALSLQRSDQKGTALALAETQIELYRNVSFGEIRLADASFSAAPLTNGSDPYFTANGSDSSIPSGSKSNQVTDLAAGSVPCGATPPPECQPVQTVTGPDHRLYRIDTYVTNVTPTSDGTSSGTQVGNAIKQVTVIVRNAQIASLPILARNSSTFSPINAAAGGGKAVPNIALDVPKAWVTANGTHIDASSIQATLTNMLPNPTNLKGVLTFYVLASSIPPSPPCGSSSWTQVGTATVDHDNWTYPSSGSGIDVAAGNTYWWYATFSGDADNMARTSRCSPAMASTVVQANKWTPTITVNAPANATTNVQVPASSFSAKLTNAAPGASGTIDIKYVAAGSAPSPCPAGGTVLGTASVTGSGTFSQNNSFTGSTGTYYWWAVYNGDTNDSGATSACGSMMPSTVVDVGATPSGSPQMFDTNGDGIVDQVKVTFNKTLAACSSPCTNGWTLSGIPGGGTLSSVSVSGSTATLSLTGGTVDTSNGTFTLQLDSSGDLMDSSGRHASVPAATPVVDKAGPVLMTAVTSAGANANTMQQGDTLDLTFSEPVNLPGGSFSATESRASGSTTLTIPNLIQSATIASGYVGGNNSSGSAPATLSLTNGNKTIHVVLGAVTNVSKGIATGSGGASIAPAAGITDSAANGAVTTVTRLANPLF